MSDLFDGGMAFPVSQSVNFIDCRFEDDHHKTESVVSLQAGGMSLRDYFAAKAMVGLLAQRTVRELPGHVVKPLTDGAYYIADAMLEARK